MNMNNKILFAILIAILFVPGVVLAAPGKITILSPADGATVESGFTFKLKYKTAPGANGNHLHLSVDGKMVAMIHALNGTTDIWPLTPGKHKICLSIQTKEHASTGVEQCINVMTSKSMSMHMPM
jgi:hypothetical protein